MMNTSGIQEIKSAPGYFKYMSDKDSLAKEAAEAYYLNQNKSQSSYSSRSSSSVNAAPVNSYYNYGSQYSPNPYTNSYNPYNHHHHHYNHHYASQTLMPFYGDRVSNSNSVGSPSTSLTIKKPSKSNNSTTKITSSPAKTQSSKQESTSDKFTRINYEQLKSIYEGFDLEKYHDFYRMLSKYSKILDKLNSIETKMTQFNESMKKTEDKLERVISNQATFTSKLDAIEKNSTSKINLTPLTFDGKQDEKNIKDLITGIKDALDIDFEIEFDVKPKIKSTKNFTSITSNPKAITLD